MKKAAAWKVPLLSPSATATPIAATHTEPSAIPASTMFPADQCGPSSPAPTSAKNFSIGPPLNGMAQYGLKKKINANHTVFCASIICICSFGVRLKNVANMDMKSLLSIERSSQYHVRCAKGRHSNP